MGVNMSGLAAIEYKVLVLPEKVETKTASGIILTNDVNQREQMAQVNAVVVDVGSMAFDEIRARDGRVPQIGDRVVIAKYAGLVTKGLDGEEYRIINDKDVAAIWDAI